MNSKRWWVVCWLSLGMVIAYTDRVNLTSAMPEIGKTLQLDAEQQGMALSAFFWTYTLGQIPAGMLVDRYGVRALYTAGILLWSLASASTVLISGLWALVATRLIVGLGESVVTSSSLRYIREHFAEKERGFAVGVYMTGTKIGPAIGLPLAAYLVASHGWQAMFLMMGLGSLMWLGPWLGWVKSDDPAALPATNRTKAESVSLGEALKSKVMWGIILGTYCYMYFVYYCMTWMPQYFQKAHNMSIQKSSWFVGVSFGGMALVAAVSGWVADRLISRGADAIGVRRAFTVAGFVMAAMQTLSVFTDSEGLMIGLTVASLCGLGLATANYWALTQTLMPGAVPVAIQNTAANLAGSVAPWLTGWMIKQTGSFDAPIKAVGFWLLLGIFAYTVMVRRSATPAEAV
ncbi:MAG TPA: MFS transporter [Bryobacteraceae bacterium]|nr:MFS transporter [Bryobacteraceae bacterium]